MDAATDFEEKKVTDVPHYLPAVSIIQPFEPMMSLKSELELRLKHALDQVESELMANYPEDRALPVLLKLNWIIHNLNYNTHKKSVAIFVSPAYK